MKIEKNLDLLKNAISERKDLRIILDSEGFGIIKFDKESNRYKGNIGYLPLESIITAYKHQLKGDDYFIKLEVVNG